MLQERQEQNISANGLEKQPRIFVLYVNGQMANVNLQTQNVITDKTRPEN